MRHRISTYSVFISHRYFRSAEYLRLVRLLDRASERDPTWRWQNRSVPVDAPIMTEDESGIGNIYEARMRERIGQVHVVLFPLRDEWLDFGSIYLELVEGASAYNYRPAVPIVSVLPRGAAATSAKIRSPGDITVGWSATSIIRAIRAHAIPVSTEELLLTSAESDERDRIVAALASHPDDLVGAAEALGISSSTLRRRRLDYVIR